MTNPESPLLACDVRPSHGPSSSVTCRTRSTGQEAVYEILVFSDGRPLLQDTKMMFKFSLQETPVIGGVTPASGVPGGIIEVSGRILTEHFEDYDFSAEFIEGPVIMESDLDGWLSLCTLADKTSDSIYPIRVENMNGTLQCRTESSYIGSHNLTFSVFNKGRSITSKDAWRISAKHELFLYQTHPEILSVSPQSGSAGGGTDVTITGDFFQRPTTVSIAGKLCEVKSISPKSITCRTTAQGEARNPPHPGNRGLQFELWDESHDQNLNDTPPAHRSLVVPDASSPSDLHPTPGRPFRARLRGYFVSPETNNYTFWIESDSRAQLFLSPSEEAARKVEIASIPRGVTTWAEHWTLDWNDSWKQKSHKMELLGGQKYYLEMLQSGTGPKSSMKVGLQIHNTWLSPEVVSSYQREKHQIVARSSWLPEIQEVMVSGEGLIQFCWDGVSSKPVSMNSTAGQIQSVIEDMLSMHCSTKLSRDDILLHYQFEEEVDESIMGGEKAGWTEPYCGRFSIFKPRYILKKSGAKGPIAINAYSHVCFAYKGYLRDDFLVSVMYNNSSPNSVSKNYTCHWEYQQRDPDNWKFSCTDLWRCIQDPPASSDASSLIYVEEILLLQVEEEENNWYFMDEIIIANGNVTVNQVGPKPARPGGHLLNAVSVSGSYPSYNLTAWVANCGTGLPLIGLCGASVEAAGDDWIRQSHDQEMASLMVTRLQAASSPIGGTFSINLSGTLIAGVPVHISPGHLREILLHNADNATVPYMDVRDFTITRDVNTCHHVVWTLSWTHMTGDLPVSIQVDAENLTGLNPTVTTRVVYDGGVFIWPIFGDMLASADPLTQVTVLVNDVPARCSGSCTFQHLVDVTPVVKEIEYSAGNRCDFMVVIAGSGFPASTMEEVAVRISEAECSIIDVNPSSITCCVESFLPLGEHEVTVLVRPVGFAVNGSGDNLHVYVMPKLFAVIPPVISQIGGEEITLRGVLFEEVTMVMFGLRPCLLITNNKTAVRCTAPSQTDDVYRENVSLQIGEHWITFPGQITYNASLNPHITSISPNVSSPAGSKTFIYLTNFDNSTDLKVKVTANAVLAEIQRVTLQGIEVTLPQLPTGFYNISVVINGILLRADGFQPVVGYILEADRVEPGRGSFLGGTLIDLFGEGFTTNTSLISVTVGSQPCKILHTTNNVITCETPAFSSADSEEGNITVPLVVSIRNSTTGAVISNSSIPNDFVFTYHRDFTPIITNLSWSVLNESLWIYLSGSNLSDGVILLKSNQYEVEFNISYGELQNQSFKISLHGFKVGRYFLKVYEKNLGFASIPPGNQTVELVPVVSSIIPGEGPVCGGTAVTICGTFHEITNSSIVVNLSEDYFCTVLSVNSSAIQCRIETGGHPNISAATYVKLTVIINDVPSVCGSNCSFYMDPQLTPVIKEVLLRLEGASFVLHVLGERLYEKLVILVDADGNSGCLVKFGNETLVKCHLDETITVGNHTVTFPFAADGHACLSNKSFNFTVEPVITNLYPRNFSLNGGGCLTIEGSGLQGQRSTFVFIGSLHHCRVTTTNSTMVRCIVPPLRGTMNVEVQVDDYNVTAGTVDFSVEYTPVVHALVERPPVLKIAVSGITSLENLHITVEDHTCGNITGNGSIVQCVVPDLPAGSYEVRCLDAFRGWAISNITFTLPLIITSLRNNIDCGSNRSLHISGSGFSPGNTSVTICESPCQVFHHLTTPTDVYCSGWELNSWLGFLCDLSPESGARCHENANTAIHCDVTVRVGTLHVTESLAYLHVCRPSRQCDGLTPPSDNSTAANITGLFISPKVEKDEVLIYMGCCSVAVATEAEMECQAPNQPIITQITAIRGSWLQNTQSDLPYYFCSLWSRNSSWPSGHPPLDGDNVTVERGRTLLLDTSTSRLNLLHIKGGSLVFRGSGPVHLHAHYILVSEGGVFQVGTDEAPFQGQASIMLYGSSYTAPLHPYGVKFLAVRNATISMHGWVPNVTVTHLAAAVKANGTELELVEPVDWRVGDEVVLCGGGYEGSTRQEEVLTIQSINGTCLTVSPSLRYSYSIIEQSIGADWIHLRPIIAVLSRDIVVDGNLTEEYIRHYHHCQQAGFSDVSDCLYDRSEKVLGSQDLGLVFTTQASTDEASQIRISGVQFIHAGQAFRKALSAVNIFGGASMSGSYIRQSVVMNSFARGIMLSGISHFTIEENIFYNIQGHGLVVGEDVRGPLRIRHNLLMKMSGSSGLSNIEALSPAAIYIQSPAVSLEDNWVCSSGYGYFYHLPQTGPSQAVLGSFRNNMAVSCMRSALWIHPEYTPIGHNVSTVFGGFTAWSSRGGAQISRCANISFKDFKIYSCQEFGLNISESGGNTTVSDSLLLGHFDGEEKGCMTSGINTPKRFQLFISNTSFINFDRQTCSALSTCTGCVKGQGGFTIKTQQITFENSSKKTVFPFPHSALIEDLSGSFSGREGSHLLATTDILPDSCLVWDDISGGSPASLCPAGNKFHRMSISLGRAANTGYSLTILNSRNASSMVNYVEDTLSSLYGWQALLLDGETYTIIFHSADMRSSLHYSATFGNFGDGDRMLVQHRELPRNLNVSITCGLRPGTPLQSTPLPGTSEPCDWFYDYSLSILTYLVAGEGLIRVTLTAREIAMPPTTPAPSPQPPAVFTWSSPDSWAGVGEGWGGHDSKIPQAGDDVIILTNRTVVVDVVLPPLCGLYILGTLEFPAYSRNSLNVTCILIAGGELRVGTSEEPLEREQRMHILLRSSEGVHCNRLSGLSSSPGVIGVYGKFQIHSAYPSKAWTRLGADAAPGNEMMALNGTVDWQPGDEIVISSTSYEAHQAELFQLRDIYGYIIRVWGRLSYRHTGTTYTIDDAWNIPLASEVGLVSRHVQIQADVPCTGGILVGQYMDGNSKKHIGSLELSNVEISNFGSSLYSAITFTNTSHKSSIISCSIHNICGGGVRAMNSTNLLLHSNVLFNVTGHGIHLDGDDHTLTENLLILIKQPDAQSEWVKGIKINVLSQVSLSGNAVAGSERIAYHVRGQSCYSDEFLWSTNIAHSSLHGLHIHWEDGFPNCTKISGFICYKNYDYGVVFHLEGSVVVEDIALVDNGVGLLPIVSQGFVESYKYPKQDVTLRNSLIVATSPVFDCIRDRIVPSSAQVTVGDRPPVSPFKGRIGFLWPVFTERPRRWPDYSWHMLGSDGAIPGIMKLQDVTFSGFTKSCYSEDADTCIMSNPSSMAIMSPVTAQRMKMLQVLQENMFYFHVMQRNSDCPGSVECSGARMALFKDLDGTFTRRAAPVTAFPKSELDVLQPCFNIGVYRNKDLCTFESNSQAHICQQSDLTVVILENMATFVEPVSPVLAVTDHFAQVFASGGISQDGCCNVTNNRTFYSILPANKITKVCFTGPTPKALRLQLHGAQNSTNLVLAIFYDVPNSFYTVSGGETYSTVLYDVAPELQRQKHGSSFFSFKENLLYVVLQGDEPVEIHTNLSVHLFFFLAPGTNTTGYDRLLLKLASLLSLDPSQVNVLQILRGGAETLRSITDNRSKRKRQCPFITERRRRTRRHSQSYIKSNNRRLKKKGDDQIEVLILEISEPNTLAQVNMSQEIAASLVQSDLLGISSSVIGGFQTGELEKTIQLQIESMMVIDPCLGTCSSSSDMADSRSCVYVRPHQLHIDVQPMGGPAGLLLPIQPKLTFLDIKGAQVRNVGHPSSPWYVSAHLKDSSSTALKGNTTVVIREGWGNFSNLVISSPGSSWRLIFNVTSPPGVSFSVQSQDFQVFPLSSRNGENVLMLVMLSTAASAIVLCLFFCCFFKRKKGLKRSKVGRKLR
ncbi:fibrocystin isoform X2 [Hyperolius riggenbachi]|uniref:fibrocystin isoform X2 n=1 Tax=Hyperolius riggenbachi TaxID=752182 RepID=UPI0035A2B748